MTSSRLATGLPAEVFQPLRFHPGSHLVTAFIAYCESIRTSIRAAGSVDSSSSARAVSSATLLVAVPSGPASQRSGLPCASATTQAQAAGPGFPLDAPSHAAMMLSFIPRSCQPRMTVRTGPRRSHSEARTGRRPAEGGAPC